MKRRPGRPIGAPHRFASTGETFLEASSRLGINPSTLYMRINTYGWPEGEALSFGSNKRPLRPSKRASNGARAGVKYGPLTARQLGILQALSEGMKPAQISGETRGLKTRAVWKQMHQVRLKLGAFTTYEMMFLVGKKRIIE